MSSRIHLNRNRQNLGQFSPEEVAEGLRSGRFLPTDLAWREGMETWQPLSAITDLPPPPEPVEMPVAEVPAAIPAAPEAPAGPAMPSWERWEEVGMFRAALRTIREVVTNPIATFRSMKRDGGFLRPFLFFYAVTVVSLLVQVAGQIVWLRILPAESTAFMKSEVFNSLELELLAGVVIRILFCAATPFLNAGLFFLTAKLLANVKVSYEPVFRTCCYAMGALSPFFAIPVPLLAVAQLLFAIFLAFLFVVYLVIAFRETLAVSSMAAAMITLTPLLFCCACLTGLVMVGTALAMGMPALQN